MKDIFFLFRRQLGNVQVLNEMENFGIYKVYS